MRRALDLNADPGLGFDDRKMTEDARMAEIVRASLPGQQQSGQQQSGQRSGIHATDVSDAAPRSMMINAITASLIARALASA